MRRCKAARLELERDLIQEEESAMDELMAAEHAKRQQMLDDMSDKLAYKVQGTIISLLICFPLRPHGIDI